MSRWPHGHSGANEIRDAIWRMRNGKKRELHALTWPFDPVFVSHTVDLIARAIPFPKRVSASYLERKLGISYAAAGLLVDTLARCGLCDRTKGYAIVHLQWPPPAAQSSSASSVPSPLQCMVAEDDFVAFAVDQQRSKNPPSSQ